MPLNNLVAPAINAGSDILVDWLELVAFFDRYHRARLDELTGAEQAQQETPEQDFGAADQGDDRLREAIENEVGARKTALNGAYPFDLDEHGEQLLLVGDLDEPATCFYLVFLIASHVAGSSILVQPPSDELVRRMRNRVFQVLGTLAVAGIANGPAVSIGYPREVKETILEVLRRAEGWGVGLTPRDKPGMHANPRAKDGGVDAIGWPSSDRPPPASVYFAQLASGLRWEDKPMLLEYDNFIADFFDDQGTKQHNFMTMIPYRLVDDLLFQRASKVHRYIADRCRGPLHALNALGLAERGVQMDEIGNVGQVIDWVRSYRDSVVDPQPTA